MFHIVTRYMLNFCPLIASFQVKFPDIIGAISIRLLSQNASIPKYLFERWERPQKVARALIARRVIVEVELVILLSSPPLSGGRNLSNDAALPPLLVGLLCDLARDLFLLLVVEVNSRAVLGAGIGTLAVQRRGVVRLVEEF
jgi:hypothetical protein